MLEVRPLTEDDRQWADEVEADSWGEPRVARLGELVDPTHFPGFVASIDGERVGLVSQPSIPERDADGIPIAHELELELRLESPD